MSIYNYWCPNHKKECMICDSKGDLQIEVENLNEEIYICACNKDVKLKRLGEVFYGKVGSKMTRQQIQKERKERSSNHFKKEVLPTLGKDEKNHFKKKFSK